MTFWSISGYFISVDLYTPLYTVSQLKQSHFCFWDDFGKCGPIATVFWLLQSTINRGKGTGKFYHHTSYLLPHYLS